jgi:hypothetical protein
VLDTWGGAYAAADRRDDAVRVAERALELATRSGAGVLAGRIRVRLEAYRKMPEDKPGGGGQVTHPDG